MLRSLTIILALLVTAPTIVGCGDNFCKLGPVPTIRTTSSAALIGGPDVGQGISPGTGACPQQVEYDGRLYWDLAVNGLTTDRWMLTDEDLTRVGSATRAMPVVFPLRDDSVYAIRGVDPADAVAVNLAAGGIEVLSVGRDYDFPDSLCPYLLEKRPVAFDWCREVSPSPDGSGRTRSQTAP